LEVKFIYWLEELSKDHGDLVGKKCANLGELIKGGFRVPPGFALSLETYDAFLKDTGLAQEIGRLFSDFSADPSDPKDLRKFAEAAKHVQALIESTRVPMEMATAITERYQALCARCGAEDVKVAVRSAGAVSHPGQYDSFLDVCGAEDVLDNVVKVWSSTFNTRSLAARARKELPLDRDPIGVCVLRMVNARAAGVMFTADPSTADNTKLTLEGSWGLGESVVSGSVIPDVWMVDRTRYAIIDRRINTGSASNRAQPETVELAGSGDRVEEPTGCLSDEEVIELARIGAQVEQHFGTPQDIEWAVDGEASDDRLYVLQTRNEKFSIRFAGF
jgi:pyruvate,water dikinase